jgi:hypothetical protein
MLPVGIFCAKLTSRMILLVAQNRNQVIEHGQRFKTRRMGLLKSAAKSISDAGAHDLGYTYDSPLCDYEHGWLFRLPDEHEFQMIDVANQRLEAVPQSTVMITCGQTNEVFNQCTYGYDFISGIHFWPSRDPLAERAGLNLYDYVFNNPANANDPLGLDIGGYGGGTGNQNNPVLFIPPPSSPAPSGASGGDPFNVSVGAGAYEGLGMEFSFSTCECCEKGQKYRVIVLTECFGIGGGAKGKRELPRNGNASAGIADSSCPHDRTYIKSEGNVGPIDYTSENFITSRWSANATTGVSVSLALCHDIVYKQPIQ